MAFIAYDGQGGPAMISNNQHLILRKILAGAALALLVLSLGVAKPLAEGEDKSGELSLPWQEFEKLLKLNSKEISLTWDEFQKLIKQTGVENLPPYQLQDGNVLLSRDEFKKLLDQMKAPTSEKAKYFLTKAVYVATVKSESTVIKAQIRLQIPGEGKSIEPLRIPLFPGQMAFQDVTLDGEPALIENDGNYLYLTVAKSGDHVVTAVFSASSSLKKPPYELRFSIPRTPITQAVVTIPLPNLEIKVANASQSEISKVDSGTQIKATLPAQEMIQVTWNPVVPDSDKGPAKVYADVFNLLTMEDDALRVKTSIELDILQNTINTLNIKIPEPFNILDVSGDGVGEWKVQGKDSRVLVVPFTFGRRGKMTILVTSELLLKEKNSVVAFDGFQVLNTVREKGFLGVELKTSAEIKPTDLKGVDRVDAQELPPSLVNLAERPLLFGFRYLRQPFSLTLDIQRHEEVAVVSTVIDEANGVTLMMEEGKQVNHLTFTVRNTWKQFLTLNLPKEAQVWSVFVEGQRVQPSRNAEGKVLIPLNRSRGQNNDLTRFDVEIMYFLATQHFSPIGGEGLSFPANDVVTSQMLWSVYLPMNFDYVYFGGNVDKEEGAVGLKPLVNVLAGQQRALNYRDQESWGSVFDEVQSNTQSVRLDRAKKLKLSYLGGQKANFAANRNVDQDLYAKQIEREVNFFRQVKEQQTLQSDPSAAGPAMALRVSVPNSGKVFRFTKQIIVENTPLSLRVVFVSHWILIGLYWLILLVAGFTLYRFRSQLKNLNQTVRTFLQSHQKQVEVVLSPWGRVVTTGGLMIILGVLSRFLFAIFFVLFAVSLGQILWRTHQNKRRLP